MLIDSYDTLAQFYPGWSLTELRNLTARERLVFLSKAATRPKVVNY